MGVDGDLTSIIREIVQFLESLYDVDLPSKIENARVNLLQRSKAKLSTLTSRGSASPEPYLDMNAGKGFLLLTKRRNRDVEIEEYVGVEEQPVDKRSSSEITSHQDYYETFQEINDGNEKAAEDADNRRRSKSWQKHQLQEDQVENKLCEIYKTFTPAKTVNKAYKSGPLYQKVERKPFGFVRGNLRPCWIGLVGSHLLVHGSEDDKQPPEICCIRGYSARPAPSSVSRDPERAKSAFEIFCPGNKTLQFVAKNPKEMEEWLEAINRTRPQEVREVAERVENVVDERSRDFTCTEEKYQDVGEFVSPTKNRDAPASLPDKPADNDDLTKRIDSARNSMILGSTTPPMLPVRTSPRRLPSLPNEETHAASYEPLDDGYEEDDIYHKIEDFCDDRRSYENVKSTNNAKKVAKNRKRKRKSENLQTETYDDVENEDSTRQDCGETYDDVGSAVQATHISSLVDKCQSARSIGESPDKGRRDYALESYDDVFQSSPSKAGNSFGKTTSNEETANTKSEKVPTESAKSLTKIEKNSTRCEKNCSKSEKNSAKAVKNHVKVEKSAAKSEKSSSKATHKRSFLDRVRHRKDSPKKEEKKRTRENLDDATKSERKDNSNLSSAQLPEVVEPALASHIPNVDLPTYDDVSDLAIDPFQTLKCPTPRRVSIRIDETSDYNCPPPPRPIYSKPPSPVSVVPVATIRHEDSLVNEIYDDIGNYGGNVEVETISSEDNARYEHDKSIARDKFQSRDGEENEAIKRLENNRKTVNRWIGDSGRFSICDNQDKSACLDSEHYQTPRADSLPLNVSAVDGDEQLYDDIAVADFRARQCQDLSSTSGGKNKSNSSSITEKPTLVAKKSWSRFGSGKKAQTSSTRHKSSLDLDEPSLDDSLPVLEKQETTKLNKFQKLINKMESTLGNKPSAKSVTPAFNKTQSE